MDKYFEQNKIETEIEFPGKILFSNFKDKNIQIRKQKLVEYLNRIIDVIPNLLEIPFAHEFFNDTPLKPIENTEQHIKNTENNSPTKSVNIGNPFIYDFLQKINNSTSDIAKHIAEFEEIYFNTSPDFNQNDIKLLLFGDTSIKLNKGLLLICGETTNFIASRAAILLFAKLISYEYNSLIADKFISVYSSAPLEIIKKINLAYSIREIKAQTAPGQNALFQYLMNNKFDILEPNEILDDKIALEEYQKWLTKKSLTGAPTKRSDSFGKSAKQSIESKKQEEIRKLLNQSLGDQKITKLLVESSNLSALNDMKDLMDQLDNFIGWKLVNSTELIDIFTKTNKLLRVTIRLNSQNPKEVVRNFYELEKRQKWDPLNFAILKKDNDYQDIAQILYENPMAKKSEYIEYILFRNIGRSEDSKSILIIERSVILPNSNMPNIKRSHINACIYKITKLEKNVECQILWKIDEGIELLAEYNLLAKKIFDKNVQDLNKLLSYNNEEHK